MNTVVLDLTGCKFPLEMHQRFRETLGFPEYYGDTWDGFWDCMMNESTVEYIEIRGRSKVSLTLSSMVEELDDILKKIKASAPAQGWTFNYKFID